MEPNFPPLERTNPNSPVPRNIGPPVLKRIGLIVGVLLVLLAAGFGVYRLANSRHSNPISASAQQPPLTAGERQKIASPQLLPTILDVTEVTAQDGDIVKLLAQNLQVGQNMTVQGNITANGNATYAGNVTAAGFTGNGSGLTGVNASLLDGRPGSYYATLSTGLGSLQADAALKTSPNTFTAANTFSGALTVAGPSSLGGTTTASSLILSTPLPVASGGTGLAGVPAASVLYGQGGPALGVATPSGAGLCLLSGATDVQWGSCSGSSGLASLNSQTGVVTLANATGAGGTVTINDASTGSKGIAQFNATNFSVAGGAVNTIQNIAVTSSPTFGGLTLSSALTVANGGTGANTLAGNGVLLGGGANPITSLVAGAAGDCLVSTAGAPVFQVCPGSGGVTTVNNQAGVLTVANATGAGGTITINDASTSAKGIAEFNATNFSAAAGVVNTIQDIASTSSPTFAAVNTNTITPSGAFTLGATAQAFTLQGNAASVFAATNAGHTTTIGFDTPTANTTLNFPALAAGSYDLCTTSGNCAGSGAGVTASGGNTGFIPEFTGAQTLTDSIISQSGSTITVAGAGVIQGTGGLTLGTTGGNTGAITFNNSTNSNTLTLQAGASSSNLTFTLPTTGGAGGDCLTTNGLGSLSFAACLSGAGGGSGGVVSLNGLSGGLSVANATGSGSTVTINDASTSQKGIAEFNNSDFTASAGVIDTIQGIATTSAPSFTGLTLTGANALTLGSASNVGALLFDDGTADGLTSTVQSATFTTNQTITVPNASGTLAVSASGNIALSATGNISFTGQLGIPNGGTGANTAAGARSNLGAAASGANSDITSLTGLTTALSVAQGGTGAATLAADGVLLGNNTSPISSLVAGAPGLCLESTAGAPVWSSCPSSGGANTSLSNLSSVAINTTLLPGSAAGADLGSGTLPFGNLFVAGSSATPGTNNFEFTGVSTGGTRTITIPDASGTMCLTSQNCSTAGSGYILDQNATPGTVQGGNFNINGAGIAVTLEGSTSVLTPLLDNAGSGTLSIGTSTATAISVGKSGVTTTVAGPLQVNNTEDINTNSATALNVEQNGVKDNVLTVDTTHGTVGIDQAPGTGNALTVSGTAQASNFLISGSVSGNNIQKNYTAGTGGVSAHDVVVLVNDSGTNDVIDTTTSEDTRVFGVANAGAAATATTQVVISGNTVVNADTAAVAIGDQLVVSGTSGEVTVDNSATAGILGYATSTKGTGAGTVDVFVRPVNGVANPNFSGNVTIQGSSGMTVGSTSNNGLVQFLDGTADGFTGTIKVTSALASSQNYLLPTTGGTFCLSSQNCSTAGSGYILNQSSTPGTAQGGNFNINGDGIVGTALFSPILDTPTGTTTLAVGQLSGGNATQINLNQNTTVASGKTFTVTAGATSLTGPGAGSSTALSVATGTATNQGLVLQGSSTQSANLLTNEDSNGVVLSAIDANGDYYGVGSKVTLGALRDPIGTCSAAPCTSLVAGGSLSSGQTYYYHITATNTQGETLPLTTNTVTATPSGGNLSVKLTWTASPGATGYKIYRNTSNSFTSGSLLLTTITNGNTVTYTDTGAATASGLPPINANQYYLDVLNDSGGNALTVNGYGNVQASGLTVTSVTGTTPQAAALIVQQKSGSRAEIIETTGAQNALEFQDANGDLMSGFGSSGNYTSYGASQNYLNLAVPTLNVPTTSSSGSLTSGTTYYYVLTATNTQGETMASSSVNATPSAGNLTVNLTWTQVTGATGYKLYRNTSNSFTSGSLLLATMINGTTTSYIDSGSATAAGLPPTAPTGAGITLQGWSGQTADLLQLEDAGGNVNGQFNGTGNQLTLGRIAASGTVSAGSLVLGDGTTDDFGATLNTTTLTANRTISLPDVSGTVCLTTQNCSTAGTGYILNQSSTPGTAQAGNFNINGTGIAATLQGSTSVLTPSLDAASAGTLAIGSTTATALSLGNTTNNILTTVNGTELVKPTSGHDSTTAFQVQDAGSNDLLTVDTAGDNVNIGATGSTALASTTNIGTSTGAAQTVNVGSGTSSSAATIQGGTDGISLLTGGTPSGNSGSIIIETGGAASGTAGNIEIDDGSGTFNSGTSALDDTFEHSPCSTGTSDFANWFGLGSPGGSLAGSNAEAHGGSCSLAATESSTDGGFWGITDSATPFVVTGGQQYTFSAWVRAGSLAQTINGDLKWSTGTSEVFLSTRTDTTTGWTQMTGSGVAPAGATYAFFEFGNSGDGNGSSTTYFDDITATAQAGAPAIDIGTSNAQTINIGNANQQAATTLQGGAGGVNILAATNANVTIGATTSTGTLTFGQSTAGETVNIANGTVASGDTNTINVGTSATGTGDDILTLGSTNGASATTIQGGTGGIALSTGAGSGTTGSISLTTGNSSGSASGNITIDNGTNVQSGTQIEDKDFETGTDDMICWFACASAPAQTTSQAHGGTHSLELDENGVGSWGLIENYPGDAAVTPGHKYALTAWVRGTISEAVNGVVDWPGSGVGNVLWDTVTDSTTGWTEMTGSVTAPAGATNAYLSFDGDSVTHAGQNYFDDITVTDLGTVSTPYINIGAANAQAITIGNENEGGYTSIYGGGDGISLQTFGGNIAVGTNNNANVQIGGVGTSSSSTFVEIADTPSVDQLVDIGGTATNGGSNALTEVNIQGGQTGLVVADAGVSVESYANSATAFQVQNTGGFGVLTADTAGNGGQGQVVLGSSSNNNGALLFDNSAGATQVGLAVTSSNTNSYTLDLPIAAPGTSQCLQSGSSTADQLTFGSCGSGGSTTLQQAYNNSAGATPNIDVTGSGGTNYGGVTIQNDNSHPITGNLFAINDKAGSGLGASLFNVQNTGATTIQTGNTTNNYNTNAAFQVQNADGEAVLQTGTLATADGISNYITDATFALGSGACPLTDWSVVGSPTTCAQNTTAADTYEGATSLKLVTTTTPGQGVTTSSFTSSPITAASGTGEYYTVSFEAMQTGGATLLTGANLKAVATGGGNPSSTCTIDGSGTNTPSTTGFERVVCTLTFTASGAISALAIEDTGTISTADTLYIDAVQLQQAGTSSGATSAFQEGTVALRGVITNPVALESTSNSQSAFQVQNSAGADLIDADTLDGDVGIGTATPSANLDVESAVSTENAVQVAVNSLTSGNGLNVTTTSAGQSGSGSLLNVNDTATLTTLAGTDTGNLANISRSLTANITSGSTYTPTLDTAATFNQDTGQTSAWTTPSFTVGSNSSRFLIVEVLAKGNATHGGFPTAVSWDGTAMTAGQVEEVKLNGTTFYSLSFWTLLAPTATTATFSITPHSGDTESYDVVADSWYNVNQTTPYGSFSENSGSSGNPSLSASSASGRVVVDGAATFGTTSLTQGGSQFSAASYGDSTLTTAIGSSYETASGSSTTMSWTAGTNTGWAQGALDLEGYTTDTETVSSPVASISNSCTQTSGVCVDATNVLSLNQQNNNATGTVLGIQNSGQGLGFQIQNGSGASALEVATANITGIDSATLAPGAVLTIGDSNTGYSIAAAGGYSTGLGDYAEYFPQAVPGQLKSGEIACLNTDSQVEPCSAANSTDSVAGVVSTAPGVVGNTDIYSAADPAATALISMLGQVPVNVSAAGGAIEPGDQLTMSDIPGVAEKATTAGMTIGTALGSFTGAGTGQIQLYIHVGFFDPESEVQTAAGSYAVNGASANFSSLNVGGDTTLNNLTVTGNAAAANLTVTGALVTQSLEVNGHITTGGNPPTVAGDLKACSGQSATISGTDTAGLITLTTSSSCAVAGNLLDVTFANAFTKAPNISLTPADAEAAALSTYVNSDTTSTTGFTVSTSAATTGSGKTYKWYYQVIQ